MQDTPLKERPPAFLQEPYEIRNWMCARTTRKCLSQCIQRFSVNYIGGCVLLIIKEQFGALAIHLPHAHRGIS